ncbi:hypothetical protein [Lacticaseibacillus camelliae]|uniref:MORN repeat-containing protein n=1 Tax=Lacticaseibacillus camelliae DSM 22697 = JCM 13995 TaxID=1423730 RepID=A0A0R2FLK7_9LACO|nr:hypothetical protein [Lacticaseibacillus camelliae]KRN25612.1 hypothetical protein FC75_GL000149 [Lacticaseibacillus camelliae DSM 22697 = JCM 13995]
MALILAAASFALRPAPRITTHYTLQDGQIVYDGQMLKGKFSGHGTLTEPNGDRYVGEFRAGRFNGSGKFSSHAGWRYTGQFKNGALTGQGTLTTKQGKQLRGYFKNGQYHAASTH